MPIIAFFASLLLSLLAVPLVRKISFRTGKVSQPRDDRWHRKPTPTLGGVGMFIGFIGGILALLLAPYQVQWSQLRSLLLAVTIMFGLGLVDDFKRLSPPSKLIVQILASAIVIFFGRVIHFFPWSFANILLTFFWLVGITNAINLLDNMDGLAGGVSLIASGFLAYFFWSSNNEGLLLLSLCLAGSILGFLIFNFPPAKIFMGDSGSMLLGFTLAALAVARQPRASEVLSALGVPVLLFLLPIIDTTLVTITRILRGQSPAQGGTDHTSHRLIAFGLSERQAVIVLYTIAILSGIAGTILEKLSYDLSLLLIPLLLIGLALLTAYLGRLKVVTKYTGGSGSLTRLMVDLTYRRRILEVGLDFILIGVTYYLAFWTLYGMNPDPVQLNMFARSVAMALMAVYAAFFAFGVYRGVWRYVSLDDLVRYAWAVVAGALLTGLVLIFLYPYLFPEHYQYPPALFLLFGVYLFLGLAGSRASFRMLDRVSGRRLSAATPKISVLLYGAEDAGELALRWILRNPSLGYQPVGFLDNDPLKLGRRIHGVSVLGGCELIEEIAARKQAAGIIITSPGMLSDPLTQDMIDVCHKNKLWVRVLRLELELLE